MKRYVIAILCLSMTLPGLMGCQKSVDTKAEALDTPTATTTASATVTEEAKETPQTSNDLEKLEAPIKIDTGIPIEKGMHIAVVVKNVETGYWKNVKKNMEEAVDYLNQEYGFEGKDKISMTYEGPKTEEDVTTQINIIDAVLSENPSVLCLAAIDVNSCEAQLETANDNGIPVIMFDSSVTSDLVTAFCGTNNKKAGKAAANKLCQAIGETGEVAVFAHENMTQTSKERVRGFRDQVKEKYPQVVLDSISYENEEESLKDMMRSVVDGHENLSGIFCTSASVAEAALDVLAEYPQRDIKIVGFDIGSKQKKAISEEKEIGTIVQNTYEMAYDTIWTAARCASETEVPVKKTNYAKYIWADASNLDALNNKQYFYD